MKHSSFHASMLVLIALLGGCTITESSSWVSQPLIPEQGQPTAYLVGAVGPDELMPATAQNQRLLFRQRGSEQGAAAIWIDNGIRQTPKDIQKGRASASVFVMPLKPGDYELYDFQFFSISSTGYGTYSSSLQAREKFVVPMRLEAGKAYYIGEYRSRCLTSSACLFMQRDRMARDESIARARVTHLPELQYLPLQLERAKPFILPERADTQTQTKDRSSQ